MAIIRTDNSHYSNIANAIRSKTGTETPYKPSEMAQAVTDLPSGDESVLKDLIQRDLTEFTVPDGCTKIGHSAFRACIYLETINIPDTVTTIGDSSFSMCYRLRMELPDGVTFIGDSAFSSTPHPIITKLPSELKTLGQRVFQYCYAPFTISEIPSKVETIGNYCFQGCTGITNLTFKGTPNSISSSTFQGCTNLLDIYVPWSEGEVANAPWGATNATIHYNSEV